MKAGSLARRPIVAGLVALAVAVPALMVLKARSEPHYAVSNAEATRIAKADPRVQRALESSGYSSARVSPLDREQLRVSFFRGPRLVLLTLVGPNRQVTRVGPGTSLAGNRMANLPPFLIVLSLLFVFAMATLPLLSLRNLDVLAFASFTSVAWLTSHGFVDASMLVAYPLLGYLIARFLWIGLRGPADTPAESLYWRLTSSWQAPERRRMPALVAVALGVIVAILTVSSSGVSDVAFAALSGATDLTHGTAPYGHIPDFIVHGDTYPPLTYLAYLPAALLMPVNDAFDNPDGALILTAVVSLVVAAGLYLVVRRTGSETKHELADAEPSHVTGLRAAIAWLAFPPALLAASSGSNDIVLALCLVAVIATLSRPKMSAVLLGVAAWVKLTPVFALPIWLARMRGRELGRALAALAVLSAVVLGSLVALGGPGAVTSMGDAIAFQFERRSLFSLWTGLGLGKAQPLAEGLLFAVVVLATVSVRNDDALRSDPLRLAALLAGVLMLSQFAANYWTWSYLPWAITPALLVLAPGRAQHRVSPVRRSQPVVPKQTVPAAVDASTSRLP